MNVETRLLSCWRGAEDPDDRNLCNGAGAKFGVADVEIFHGSGVVGANVHDPTAKEAFRGHCFPRPSLQFFPVREGLIKQRLKVIRSCTIVGVVDFSPLSC